MSSEDEKRMQISLALLRGLGAIFESVGRSPTEPMEMLNASIDSVWRSRSARNRLYLAENAFASSSSVPPNPPTQNKSPPAAATQTLHGMDPDKPPAFLPCPNLPASNPPKKSLLPTTLHQNHIPISMLVITISLLLWKTNQKTM